MDMIDAITKEFVALGYVEPSIQGLRDFKYLNSLHELEVSMLAEMLCAERQYPPELANRNIPHQG